MELHADLNQRAVLDPHALDWSLSPMAGVERRMLDRRGAEVARATSLVRYAPGSCFERHVHHGGEEILVPGQQGEHQLVDALAAVAHGGMDVIRQEPASSPLQQRVRARQ